MSNPASTADLLGRAREGDRVALGELLEAHRPYLKVLAQRLLDGRVDWRVDSSDLVQEVCLSVQRDIGGLHGETPAEFIAWLGQVLRRDAMNLVREHTATAKRAVDRERPMVEDNLAKQSGGQSSPSRRAMRGEQAVRLARALEQLPESQREAVRLRYLEGWPLQQIAEQMGRSTGAVGNLVCRGLIRLRELLAE